MNKLIVIFFVLFILITIANILGALFSFSFLTKKRKLKKEKISGASLVMLVPLLNEQAVIKPLLDKLKQIVIDHNIFVVLVTTERENKFVEKTTMAMVDDFISKYDICNRIERIHYSKVNKVISEQLNFGLDYIITKFGQDAIIGLYNADSIFDSIIFDQVLNDPELVSGKCIIQQSSFFVHNIPDLVNEKKYLTAAFGIHQSGWTICHEIPRYLTNKTFNLPFSIRLVHCVGHGLFAKSGLIKDIGGFPMTAYGGEDIALGFVANVYKIKIKPVGFLENCQTPKNIKILFKQQASWFMALLGYFEYHKLIYKPNIKEVFLRIIPLTLFGIISCMRWILSGPIFILLIIYSLLNNFFIEFIAIYMLYCWIPFFIVSLIWQKQDCVNFPIVSSKDLIKIAIIYPLVPIIKSIPAFIGLFWMIKVVFKKDFYRPNTER